MKEHKMKGFDEKKFKFYCKYLIPYGKIDEFHQRLNSIQTAVKINLELVEEAKQKLIEEYPFTKEFLE